MPPLYDLQDTANREAIRRVLLEPETSEAFNLAFAEFQRGNYAPIRDYYGLPPYQETNDKEATE